MKKSSIFGAFAALSICLIISSCSGIGGKDNSSASEQKEATYYKLTGNIKLNGALPSAAAKSNNSRSATSSLDVSKITFTKDDFDIYASRTKNVSAADGGNGPGYKNPTININDWTYTIEVNDYATFDVYCYLWEPAFYGKSSFDFTEDMANAGTAPDIVLYPHSYESEKEGLVKLEITDTSGKIKSVSYKGDVLGFYDAQNNSFEIGSSADFTSGKATVELEDVHPNSYEVTFTFTDDVGGKGNVLYECKEAVAVFGGFTTDTWLGEGAHLVKNSSGKVEFKITQNLLDSYDAEIVPESKYLLYSRWPNSESDFNYYIVDSLNSSMPESANFTNDSSYDSNKGYADNYSCFDKDGYYYVITKQEENATYITSNKSGFGTDGVMKTGFNIGNFLSADRKTGIFYSDYPSSSLITQLTNSEGEWFSGTATVDYYIYDERNTRLTFNDVFAVYDNVAYLTYVPEDSENNPKLYVADLTKAENEGGDLQVVAEAISFPNTVYEQPRITDMIYQDCYVYLLLRYDDIKAGGDMSFYSTGAVIRFNTFTKQFETTAFGLADAIEHDNDAYVEVKNESDKKFYTEDNTEDTDKELVIKAKDIGVLNLYSPKTTLSGSNLQLSTTAFYGPQKFIAIKPKKLVISDDGIAFYTDAEGLYKYKNVNRVVIVDLEKFSIEDTTFESVATSAVFDFTETNGSAYLQSNNSSGSYWKELPQNIPVYLRGTKEEFQNCVWCGAVEYQRGDDFKFFAPTGNEGCGGRPLIRRED